MSSTAEQNVILRDRKRLAKRARHRLQSIHYDVEQFVRPTLQHASLKRFPVLANRRCGTWYAYPFVQNNDAASCYFKSTDGHPGTWNFSLKRLNLNVVRDCSEHGGCVILDASASKELPDSLSRTVPIWAAVMNRIAARYRMEFGIEDEPRADWDIVLHTPDFVVPKEEHEEILALLDRKVESLFASQAIVDPKWLVSTLRKPLRPFWITPQHWDATTTTLTSACDEKQHYPLICINCSEHRKKAVQGNGKQDFIYTPGAADDHESWARRLNPRQFWDNVDRIILGAETEDATELVIDSIVERELKENEALEMLGIDENGPRLFDTIGNTMIAIGTRRAGRPPECWQNFDAVLNVTDTEYRDVADQYSALFATEQQPDRGYYLQLPVKEGKRDRSELERWMAVGAFFVWWHARLQRRTLIHCAQGKDRSVAMAMCIITLFCDLKYPVQWREGVWELPIDDLLTTYNTGEGSLSYYYHCSGLRQHFVDGLLGRNGRDLLIEWVRRGLRPATLAQENFDIPPPLATKETLRVALLLIQQDHDKADPSRSTMQKLNRFFMSKTTYEDDCNNKTKPTAK